MYIWKLIQISQNFPHFREVQCLFQPLRPSLNNEEIKGLKVFLSLKKGIVFFNAIMKSH